MAAGRVRRVVGPPVFWKECRIPLLGKRKILNVLGMIAVIGLLGLTYFLCAREGALNERETQVMYLVIFFVIGTVFTTVLPATCISTERESQTWTLLLTTSMSEWEILVGKFGGVVRRCAPAWALLFGHLVVFTLIGWIHPMAILQLGVLVAWVVVFLGCTGMYFSLRFKHTTTAVIANMSLAVALWAVGPLTLAIILNIARANGDLFEVYMDTNPVVHAVVIAMATAQRQTLGVYEWIQGGMGGAADATGWILLTAFVYVSVGAAFAAWTGLRMRRNPI